MLVRNIVIAPANHPAEMRPETLNRVGEHIAVGILGSTVVDHCVGISLSRLVRCRHWVHQWWPLTPQQRTAGWWAAKYPLRCPLPRRRERRWCSQPHPSCCDGAALHHTEHGSLCLHWAPLNVRCAHRPMLPLLLAADVHLIALDSTLKGIRIALLIEQTNLLKHIPGGGLSHVNVTAQMMAADTLLVRWNEVHCHKPLDKGQLGVLEDCANQAGEIPLALVAAEPLVLASTAMVSTAVGADNVLPLTSPHLFSTLVLQIYEKTCSNSLVLYV